MQKMDKSAKLDDGDKFIPPWKANDVKVTTTDIDVSKFHYLITGWKLNGSINVVIVTSRQHRINCKQKRGHKDDMRNDHVILSFYSKK